MPYTLTYPDYKDIATGKTLVVTPGSAYTIALAPGRASGTPAYPNDGRWTSVSAFTSMDAETDELKNLPASGTLKAIGPAPADAADDEADSDKPKEGA